ALGLECVSRGAREVVFVDNNKSSVELIKKNCQLVGHNGNVILFDYANFLNSYEGQKFDIIFIDPPYNSDFYKIALEIISSRNLLNADGIISCEHSATVQLPDKVGMMEKSSIRKVGLVEFSFYTLCKEEKK
ncbi:MAG: RsmD family RNA methyltransferase, partial [Clostridia bacterium]